MEDAGGVLVEGCLVRLYHRILVRFGQLGHWHSLLDSGTGCREEEGRKEGTEKGPESHGRRRSRRSDFLLRTRRRACGECGLHAQEVWFAKRSRDLCGLQLHEEWRLRRVRGPLGVDGRLNRRVTRKGVGDQSHYKRHFELVPSPQRHPFRRALTDVFCLTGSPSQKTGRSGVCIRSHPYSTPFPPVRTLRTETPVKKD